MAALTSVEVNRAPVLTLWGAIVAERLGHNRDTALTLGKAVAGLNAQSKGRRLGIFPAAPAGAAAGKAAGEAEARKPKPGADASADADHIELLGRSVPVAQTPKGLRALAKDRAIEPAAVEKALVSKFGDALDDVTATLRDLARAIPPRDLAVRAFSLYEQFRPEIPAGTRGWGAKGTLDLRKIRALATRARSA